MESKKQNAQESVHPGKLRRGRKSRTAGRFVRAFFGAGSERCQISIFRLFSPQPPVPRRERAGRAAGRWALGLTHENSY
jgi:hypothetical protein